MIKLEDIEKLMDKSSYEINVSFKQIERTLKEFEEDYGLELNPDFQRGHVWTEEQQIA